MYRHLDIGLGALNRQLVTMAGYVEQAIEASTQAWRQRSLLKVRDVYAIEQKVNQAHIEVDDACVKLLALQQPMAADLRFIIAIIKINTDLERMVDLAVNIAQNTEYYLRAEPMYPLGDMNTMADEVRVMLQEVFNAFVRMDERLARSVLHRDDTVDSLKRKIFGDVLQEMRNRPDAIEQGLNIILMAKNLERIGDHATNVAEDIIYMSSGEDIRHASSTNPGEEKGK